MSSVHTDAAGVPVPAPSPISAYGPLTFDVPGRPVPLEVKVTAPVIGDRLPVLLFSHGHGASRYLSSLHGYGPLTEFWAAHGFAVLQPTHLDSGDLDLRESPDPQAPLFWRSRPEDMRFLLDHLDEVEATVPGLAGRLDRARIAVAGHSLGGHTAAMLLGMRVTDPVDGSTVDLIDDRVRAGVILAGPGVETGSPAVRRYPVLAASDFSTMATPTLVVAGDRDINPAFSERLSFRWDSYTLSPAPKTLLTLVGAEHILGGVSGFDAAETTDEDPQRVAMLRGLVWAYLHSTLHPGDPAWDHARASLSEYPSPPARVEQK